MLQILGFDDRWIKWIMLCVTSVRYTVLMNGSEVGPIIPNRGLRQGCPLSPYLFIICAEGLSALLRQAESSGLINGSKVCRGASSISHLFFADDSFLFFKSIEEETRVIHRILEMYERYSGQAINLQKSGIMFSSNVRTDKKQVLSAILGVTNGINTGRYLGLPSLIGRSKRATFSYIKDTIWKRIQGWRNKLLSKAGKGVLIKSVAQAIPTYSMSVFLLTVSVCDEIQKMMNSFWWGSSSGNGKGIRWQSWARLARAKELGGMGFCDLQVFNLALLGKQGWNFIHNPNTLVARLFKAKYFPHGSYLSSSLGCNPSFVWRSVWSAKEVVNKGIRWRVGDCKSIYVWRDAWVRDLHGFRVGTTPASDLVNLKVSDLLLDAGRGWDSELVHSIFENNDSRAICSIPLSKSQTSDSLIWHYSNSGLYTVKSCYRMLTGSLHETKSRLYVSSWKKL